VKTERRISKSEALRSLRTMFGSTVRIAHVDRAGVPGLQVLRGSRVLLQTFDTSDGVWRRLVRGTLALWREEAKVVA
jgi:hypothetical protein